MVMRIGINGDEDDDNWEWDDDDENFEGDDVKRIYTYASASFCNTRLFYAIPRG